MGRRVFVGLLGLGVASLSGAPAFAGETEELLARIAKARAGLKTLEAPFTQERQIGLLATAVKSRGRLTMVMPDALRWELEPPDAVTYWITREGFAYQTPGGKGHAGKSAAGRFGAVLGDLLVLLGGDLGKLSARYDLSASKAEGGGVRLRLVPKAEDVKKHLAHLELVAGSELWSPERVTIEEKGGDRSVITFGKVERDVSVPPSKMRPPKG